MEKGKYYYVEDVELNYHNDNFFMIGLSSSKMIPHESQGDDKRANYKYMISNYDGGKIQKNNMWCYKSNDRTYREANSLEIRWLKQCIKENRYVPKDQVKWKSSYEIYY